MKLNQWKNIFHVILKWNNKTCQCECKNYCTCKKDYSWNPSTCICENSKHLKILADTSVTECDEIIIVIDKVLIKKTNTIVTNVTSTASINCHSIKVRDILNLCYVLHTVSLAIIWLLVIVIIWYHYAKQEGTIQIGK